MPTFITQQRAGDIVFAGPQIEAPDWKSAEVQAGEGVEVVGILVEEIPATEELCEALRDARVSP